MQVNIILWFITKHVRDTASLHLITIFPCLVSPAAARELLRISMVSSGQIAVIFRKIDRLDQ